MAFRKRNIPLNSASSDSAVQPSASSPYPQHHPPGTRPSLLTSALVTSTGSSELDNLLGGHGGLALGSSLLIGEHGTTDFAGALLRAFAAEGVLQGHVVHIVGVGQGWVRNLPGIAEDGGSKKEAKSKDENEAAQERMKIAWRYESLGRAGEKVLPSRTPSAPSMSVQSGAAQTEVPFSHHFNLTRRLDIPSDARIHFLSVPFSNDPLLSLFNQLRSIISSSPATSVHRIVVPLLLSPAIYPQRAGQPDQVLRFMHNLKALLQRHQSNVTAMLTLPLSLYSRATGLVRWLEHISDGVLEMLPFPYLDGAGDNTSVNKEESPQGMFKVVKLPFTTERGEGGAGAGNSIGEDLAFTLGRRKFAIKPFSLPPMEGDQEAQKDAGKLTAKDVEF